MKLSERKRQILSTIAQAPRTARHFTQGQLHQITSPDVIDRWLLQMAEYGLLYEDNGVYHITAMGRHALDQKPTTATMRQMDWKNTTYDPKKHQDIGTSFQRPGSDHSHIKSYGTAC